MPTLPNPPLHFACAAALGLALSGCPVERTPNPEHCYNADGDQTCAARYGADRPYCAGPGDGCPTADYGCVADLPVQECYSPCGGEALATDDSTCLGLAEDSGTETGESGGQQPDLPAACGDGMIDSGEACDDGNMVDDDACSNACQLPACSDGITQTGTGETCDDGNTQSGDACAANCTLPGTEIWSQYYPDHSCVDAVVRMTADGEIVLALNCDAGQRTVLRLDPEGQVLSTLSTPLGVSTRPSLALLSDGSMVVGGVTNTQGQVRSYDTAGNLQWSQNIPLADSSVSLLAVSTADDIVAAGVAGANTFIYSYSSTGSLDWSKQGQLGSETIDLEFDPSDRFTLLKDAPMQVGRYAADGTLVFNVSTAPGVLPAGLAVTSDSSTYIIASVYSGNPDAFYLHKLGASGSPTWLRVHDEAGVTEYARSVSTLPGDGALIVGDESTGSGSDGLLSWYTAEGENIINVLVDGPEDQDMDSFTDVAVTDDGYAVAVGLHDPGNGMNQLWLVKFAI